MEILISDNKIEGFCHIAGRRSKIHVVTLLQNRGEWTVGSSMCLPSDIVASKKIVSVYAAAFQALYESNM